MADLIDTLVGEYRIVRQLGQGGMGEVYEALHPIIGKRAAVKVLKRELADDESQLRRFIEEARAVTAIRHASIVEVFGFGTLPNGQLYLVMDLLEGTSFHAYLKQHAPLEPHEAMRWLIQLLDAISAAHATGVVHRDLKPSNLFLVGAGEQRTLKVLDFGIARQVKSTERLTLPNVVLGTPSYVAPEQIRGEAHFATDLYAIGCIAWGMLTGRVLFEGHVLDVLNKHLLEVPAAPSSLAPNVSPALDAFVLKLLAKKPGDRPPSAAAARDKLRVIAFAEAGRAAGPNSHQRATDVNVAALTELHPIADAGELTVDERRAIDVQLVEETAPLQPRPVRDTAVLPARGIGRVGLTVAGGLLAGLGVVGALFVATRSTSAGEAASPPASIAPVAIIEPPPVEAAPSVEAPSEVLPAPAVREAPVEVPARVRPAGPSTKEVYARLARCEAAVKEGRARGGRNSAMLLEDARERLANAKGAPERHDVQAFLEDWERRYLR